MPVVFEGEAPETDEEDEVSPRAEPHTPAAVDDNKKPKFRLPSFKSRPRHVDELLESRWRRLAADTAFACEKRTSAVDKVAEQLLHHAADTFTSLQHAGVKLNVVQSNITRLEDAVADLVEARKLIPHKIHSNPVQMPVFGIPDISRKSNISSN